MFSFPRLRLEKQSLEDKLLHLDGNLRQLETEKEDLKNTVKTAGIERIKLSQTKDETEIDNGNLKAEVN